MTDAVLELCELRRTFPGFELGPLSLQLRPGQVYGLLGPNGAGKTTLLDLLALQLKVTAGTLRTGGRRIGWGARAWKAQLSYIREVPSFYDALTIAQTLKLAAQLYGRWDHDLAARLVDTLGLPLDRRVGPLSKGTKIKLGIVTALAHHAGLLLLDEPTAGLDPSARANVQDTIRRLIRDHPSLCVVLSSHIFEDIEAAATEILILRRGRFSFTARADTLRSAALYRAALAGTVPASPDLVARWRRGDTEWLLVRRESPLDADLRRRTDHVEEYPPNVLAAVYHGTEYVDVD